MKFVSVTALAVFQSRGIAELMPIDPCVNLLEVRRIGAEFLNRIRAFLASLAIMPRPEAMPFVRDAKRFLVLSPRWRQTFIVTTSSTWK